MFTDEELEEFRRIYREEFGEELSRKEAFETALRAVQLFELLQQKPPSQPKKPRQGLLF